MEDVFIESEELLEGTKYILTIQKEDSARYVHLNERTAKLTLLALAQEVGPGFPPYVFGVEVARAMLIFLQEVDIAEDSVGDLMQFTEWIQNYEPIVG